MITRNWLKLRTPVLQLVRSKHGIAGSSELHNKEAKNVSGSSSSSASSPSSSSSSSTASSSTSSISEKFPYSNVSESQFREWTDELQEFELPFRAFFARHRPLMVMEKNINSQTNRPTDPSYPRYIQVWNPSSSLFDGGSSSVVSQKIASSLGPFDVRKVDYSSSESAPSESDMSTSSASNKVTGCTVLNLKDSPRKSSDPSTTTLILARTSNNDSPLQTVISFLNDNAPESFVSEPEFEISATSVKRKRKLKMNRHKYRKRLKAQRALRKRLGK